MNTSFKPGDFDGITLGKKLGQGTYGTVFVGLLRDGRFVAVKQLQLDEDDDGSPNLEVQIHSKLAHPNIIRYLHSVVDKSTTPAVLNVFLELVSGGSLTSIMASLPGHCLPRSVVKIYARHLFEGLAYLHGNKFAHRDIKCDNILVSQDTGIAKLANFDQVKVVAHSATFKSKAADGKAASTLAGTPFFIAPEVVMNDDGYDPFKADVWSAGCTVSEMFTGRPPWKPMSNVLNVISKIANTDGWPDDIPTDKAVLGDDLHDLLSKCFERDPLKRPSSKELLAHPFLLQ